MTKERTIIVSDEDYEVAMEALRKHWDEQKRRTAIKNWNTELKIWISACISAIGLEETKTLIREANRDLRTKGEDAC